MSRSSGGGSSSESLGTFASRRKSVMNAEYAITKSSRSQSETPALSPEPGLVTLNRQRHRLMACCTPQWFLFHQRKADQSGQGAYRSSDEDRNKGIGHAGRTSAPVQKRHSRSLRERRSRSTKEHCAQDSDTDCAPKLPQKCQNRCRDAEMVQLDRVLNAIRCRRKERAHAKSHSYQQALDS